MGGKTGTTTQSVTIPPEVLARYNRANEMAETAAAAPFQKYTGQFVAPLTATQQQGMAATQAASNMAQPYYGVAGQAYGAGLGQGLTQIAPMGTGRIKVIQRAGDQQVSVGVKVLAELVALVAQVTLNLKLHVLRRIQIRSSGGAIFSLRRGISRQARAADPA
jgi:hypothetical protein